VHFTPTHHSAPLSSIPKWKLAHNFSVPLPRTATEPGEMKQVPNYITLYYTTLAKRNNNQTFKLGNYWWNTL